MRSESARADTPSVTEVSDVLGAGLGRSGLVLEVLELGAVLVAVQEAKVQELRNA